MTCIIYNNLIIIILALGIFITEGIKKNKIIIIIIIISNDLRDQVQYKKLLGHSRKLYSYLTAPGYE